MNAKQRAVIYQVVRSRGGPICGRILHFLKIGGADYNLSSLLSYFPELELFKPRKDTKAHKPWFRAARYVCGYRYERRSAEKTRDIILLFCIEMAKKKKK